MLDKRRGIRNIIINSKEFEFCERNTFDILKEKYGADFRGEFTLIVRQGIVL
jgi:hypothetical protein